MRHRKELSVFGLVKRLFCILDKRMKWLLAATLAIGLSASIVEVASIGITLSFLQQVKEISILFTNETGINPVIRKSVKNIIISGFSLILVINFSASIRLFSLWFNDKVSAIIANYTIGQIYGTFLSLDFKHIKRIKSATFITTLNTYHVELVYTITNLIQLCSASIMAIGILTTITVITPVLTFLSIIVIGGAYLIIALTIRKEATKNSRDITRLVEEQLIRIQETWGDIRNIILSNQQQDYSTSFIEVDKYIRGLKLMNSVFGFMPRFIMEALGITTIAIFSMGCIYFREGQGDVLAVVGAFALGTIRLLPYVQNIYSRILDLKLNKPGTFKALEYVPAVPLSVRYRKEADKDADNKRFEFRNVILEDVSWSYDRRSDAIFKDVCLKIENGEALGIVGKSGSGKTTLVDIIITLFKPQFGSVYVNDCNIWENEELRVEYMRGVHYVNQSIYFRDTTVECFITNATASQSEWDHARLIECIEMAGISHLLRENKITLDSKLGENASRLSGGERQRLAVARALYVRPSILILDEPTSALDKESETIVVNALKTMKGSSTMILISHNHEPRKICDRIITMDRLKMNDM